MRNAHRNRIVLVIELNCLLDLQEEVDHLGYLLLIGLAVTGRRAFDLPRRIFTHWHSCALCCVQDGAAHFRDLHRGLRVVVEEKALEGDGVGGVDTDEAPDFISDGSEPLFKGSFRRGLHAIRIDVCLFSAVFLEDCDAAAAEAGVDGEDFHRKSVPRELSSLYTTEMTLHLWRGLVNEFISVYKGKSLLWHVLAIGLTAILVLSGADWKFFEATRQEIFYWPIMIAGIGGFFVPVLIPLGVYLWGEFARRPFLMAKGAAAGRAVIIAYLVSIIYKSLTGREEPEFLTTFSMVDNSRAFDFGFLEYGVFWGWPSSHTAVAFALSFTLIFLSRSLWIRLPAVAYAIFIGFGAAVGFHWLSDVVAGAIFGLLVATVVSRNFSVK